MTVINTNVGALTAQAAMSKNNANMESAIERLSTGLRINSAADDAAGNSIANKLESQIRGLNQAIRNASDRRGPNSPTPCFEFRAARPERAVSFAHG